MRHGTSFTASKMIFAAIVLDSTSRTGATNEALCQAEDRRWASG